MRQIVSIPSPNKYAGRIVEPDLIVIHATVSGFGTAGSVGRYFAKSASKVSATRTYDNTLTVESVPVQDTPWCAYGHNSNGIHLELCAYKKDREGRWVENTRLEWLTQMEMLRAAARDAAMWMDQYSIPYRYPAPILNGKARRGIHAHLGLPGNDHTDPGRNFPWDVFLKMVRRELGILHRVFVREPGLSAGDLEKRENIGVFIMPASGADPLRARGWHDCRGMIRWLASPMNTPRPGTVVNVKWQDITWTNNPAKDGQPGWKAIDNAHLRNVCGSIYRRFAG